MSRIKMHHKGYVVAFDPQSDGTWYGRITDIPGLITAEAETLADCPRQAREAVDDYLETCAELGVEPNTPKEHL